jgi:hypothetical protein
MGQILDLSQMDIKNDDLDYSLDTHLVQNIHDELQFCKDMKALPGNGFWDNRTHRQIGSIPSVAYVKALQDGYDLESNDKQIRSTEFKRYLNDYPQYRTVEHIVTPGQKGNGLQLIIK